MSIIDKNPNEIMYVHGKKHFADVIKNSGSGDMLIWKQPEEDFNNNSTLIVSPGEQAIFVKDGRIEEVFENGKYVLSTENYPFISRLTNAFTGGVSAFNCYVYFVKISDSKEYRWGTTTPIRIRDKKWNVVVDVRSRGFYKIKIVDAVKFITKAIGSNTYFLEHEDLKKYIFGEFVSIIRAHLASYLDLINDELIGIEKNIDNVSKYIKSEIEEVFLNYGLECISFSIAALDIDKSKYDEIDKSQIERISVQREAEGKVDLMNILGDSWGIQQSVDILKDAAKNTNTAGMLIGLQAGSLSENLPSILQQKQSNDNSDESNYKNKLKLSKELLDEGLITNEEYESIKREIIKKLMG